MSKKHDHKIMHTGQHLDYQMSQVFFDELHIPAPDYYLGVGSGSHGVQTGKMLAAIEEIIGVILSSGETFVLPLHPRTRKNLAGWGMLEVLEKTEKVVLTEPQNFMSFTALEKSAHKIMTDSGGVQKEAYFFDVPCVTVRDETEWVETLESGWNVLVGAHRDHIIEALLQERPKKKRTVSNGDGKVSERIADIIDKTMVN